MAAELGHRLPEKRNARRVAVGQPGGQPVEQQIRDRGGCGGARRPQRGLRRLPDQGAAGQAPSDMRGPQRVQVGVPGQAQVQRLEPLGGAQQQPGRLAGPAGVGDLGPQPVGPGPLQIIRGPASAALTIASAASCAPARCLACAAARPRRARVCGSGVSRAARSRNAAAAAIPPRAWARPADRSSSAATSSSDPAAAWARCQARRSGSTAGSVASASTACACRRTSSEADR